MKSLYEFLIENNPFSQLTREDCDIIQDWLTEEFSLVLQNWINEEYTVFSNDNKCDYILMKYGNISKEKLQTLSQRDKKKLADSYLTLHNMELALMESRNNIEDKLDK